MVLTYGCERWKLSEKAGDLLNSFERKILRRVSGPVRETEMWTIRCNEELNREYGYLDLASCITFKRLQRA
jgi:hypothetical protein